MSDRGEETSAVRALLICPDEGLAHALRSAAGAAPRLVLADRADAYPDAAALAARLAGHGALLIDVGTDRAKALETVRGALEARPDLAVVALHRANDPEAILQCLRAGASEFLSSPFPPGELRQAVQRIARRNALEARPAAARRGRLTVFAPVKGGAGATTLAMHVAYGLRRETKSRVLLADLSLSAGVVAFLLRLQSQYSALDALRHSSRLDEALWRSIVVAHDGVDVLAAPERPEPALIEAYPVEETLEFARSLYDHVVVDLGGVCESPGMTAAAAADSVNLVCSVDMPSLYMMRRTVPLLEEMGRPRDQVNVLVNRLERRAELSTEDMEKIFRASVHATFPDDPAAVLRAQREGGLAAENSEFGRAAARFVRGLVGAKSKADASPLGALRQLWGGA